MLDAHKLPLMALNTMFDEAFDFLLQRLPIILLHYSLVSFGYPFVASYKRIVVLEEYFVVVL